MNRRIVARLLVSLIILGLLSPSTMAYKKVKTFMPQAPEISLGAVKQIAVLDLKPAAGTSKEVGKFIADKVIENLLTENRGIRDIKGGLLGSSFDGATLVQGVTTKCYSIVERSRLEAVLNEQSLSTDGLVDDAQAVEIGKLLGVDIILYGDVSVGAQDTKSVETRTSLSGNTAGQDFQVGCISRAVTVSANLRVVNTQSGEIIGTHRGSRVANAKFCDGDKTPLADVGNLAGRCATDLSWEFANMISPWYAPGEFEREKIKAKEFKDDAEDAAEAAEKLDMHRAYALYKKLYDADPYNPQFLYNLGIIYEVTGDFVKAKEMYDNALSLKQEKNYKEAVDRIAVRMPLVAFCENAGTPIQLYDFESSASDATLLAKRITIKGGSDDRVEVYEQPADGAAVGVKVPGGIELEVIEESGDFYLVKLMGGKQGYLRKSSVKN